MANELVNEENLQKNKSMDSKYSSMLSMSSHVVVSHDPYVEIYYEIIGSGQPVVFINGMSSIAHLWDVQVDALSDGYACLIFDNRGSGMSTSPPNWYTTKDMAKDTLSLMKHVGWESAHIVGISMGGMIAQELAFMLGEKVKSLTLISTYSKFSGMPLTGLRNVALGGPSVTNVAGLADTLPELLFPQDWLDAAPKSTRFSTNREWIREYILDRHVPVGLQDPVGSRGQQFAAVSHYCDNRLDQIRKHGYPILVCTGDKDSVLVQPASSEYLASRLGARLEIYPNGGHAIRLQDPEWMNARLLETFSFGTLIYDKRFPHSNECK